MFLELQYVQKPGKLVIDAIPANSLDLVTQLIFELPGTLGRGAEGIRDFLDRVEHGLALFCCDEV